MCHRHADIAQHGRVRQVALQARNGELAREELIDGNGHTEVTLRILEVDRIDLVRHGARSYLTGLDLLLEVLGRDIHPHIARQVDQDGRDALQGIEHGGQVVVVLDLRGVLRAAQAELFADKSIGKRHPIHRGIGGVVGVHITRSATELGRHGDSLKLGDLLLQALDIDQELLTEHRGRGGLTMGAGQHRHRHPLLGHRANLGHNLLEGGIEHLLQGLLHREGYSRVVDILRRQAEVHELLVGLQTDLVHLLLEDVLDRLHVVIRHGFDLLDTLGRGGREVEVQRAKCLVGLLIYAGELRQREFAQGDEVFNLDTDAVTDQCLLGKIVGQTLRHTAVAAINGGNCSQWSKHMRMIVVYFRHQIYEKY